MNKPAKSLKVVRIGNSAGVILSRELMARLRVELGDELSLSEVPGGFTLTRHDPDFETQMNAAREMMARRRNALRELAK
ncbi:AbrB/MazE/SpoVT family DNA-binding domain-containing protein [Sphingomonas sp.]|jgi:putative addiction module antidote|uniref:AbrB/MazE/SpoVT family DNA-binding domain-containing protein n=1 Tax=Sphingomonas sp. TaxID=28214 RepID=UPI002ED9C3DA